MPSAEVAAGHVRLIARVMCAWIGVRRGSRVPAGGHTALLDVLQPALDTRSDGSDGSDGDDDATATRGALFELLAAVLCAYPRTAITGWPAPARPVVDVAFDDGGAAAPLLAPLRLRLGASLLKWLQMGEPLCSNYDAVVQPPLLRAAAALAPTRPRAVLALLVRLADAAATRPTPVVPLGASGRGGGGGGGGIFGHAALCTLLGAALEAPLAPAAAALPPATRRQQIAELWAAARAIEHACAAVDAAATAAATAARPSAEWVRKAHTALRKLVAAPPAAAALCGDGGGGAVQAAALGAQAALLRIGGARAAGGGGGASQSPAAIAAACVRCVHSHVQPPAPPPPPELLHASRRLLRAASAAADGALGAPDGLAPLLAPLVACTSATAAAVRGGALELLLSLAELGWLPPGDWPAAAPAIADADAPPEAAPADADAAAPRRSANATRRPQRRQRRRRRRAAAAVSHASCSSHWLWSGRRRSPCRRSS